HLAASGGRLRPLATLVRERAGVRILKIIIGAVLFAACVYLATSNMHTVDLVFPDIPIQGWPQIGRVQAPLFLVILTSLLAGVLFTGLLTLLEQVRLRT